MLLLTIYYLFLEKGIIFGVSIRMYSTYLRLSSALKYLEFIKMNPSVYHFTAI